MSSRVVTIVGGAIFEKSSLNIIKINIKLMPDASIKNEAHTAIIQGALLTIRRNSQTQLRRCSHASESSPSLCKM